MWEDKRGKSRNLYLNSYRKLRNTIWMFDRHCKRRKYSKGFWIIKNFFLLFFSRFFIQHLLRQGREAVIVPHELDVVSSEISEEAPAQAGDMVRGAIYESVTVFPQNPGFTALRRFWAL